MADHHLPLNSKAPEPGGLGCSFKGRRVSSSSLPWEEPQLPAPPPPSHGGRGSATVPASSQLPVKPREKHPPPDSDRNLAESRGQVLSPVGRGFRTQSSSYLRLPFQPGARRAGEESPRVPELPGPPAALRAPARETPIDDLLSSRRGRGGRRRGGLVRFQTSADCLVTAPSIGCVLRSLPPS